MRAYPIAPAPVPSAAELEQQSTAGRVVEYLRARWAAFLALDRSMLDMMARASRAAAAAGQRGDTATQDMARASLQRLAELRELHDRAVRMFESVRDMIPSFSGLGQLPLVPLAVVGVVLTLGAMVTYIFSRVGAEERIVRLLEAGQLTPAEAERLLSEADQPGGAESFTSALKWIVGGLLVFALLRTFREASR